jgi:hypothetical protein
MYGNGKIVQLSGLNSGLSNNAAKSTSLTGNSQFESFYYFARRYQSF